MNKPPPASNGRNASGQGITLLMASLDGGGIQTSTARLASELVRRGHPTTLVVMRADGPVAAMVDPNCELVDLRRKRISQALPRLVRFLRARKPEVLISAQTFVNTLAIVARAFAGQPKRLVVTEHIAMSGVMRHRRTMRESMRPLLIRTLYPFADAVVAVSRDARDDLYRVAGLREEVHVIHNGIDLDEIQRLAVHRPAHPWLDQPELKVVLGVGRLSPQKNFAALLRAFALVRDSSCRLIIAGEGPELPALTRLARDLGIEERVAMPGFTANPFPLMRTCKVFVLASRWEGFPTVILEALACGTPIVATDCPGGPADILGNGRFGRLIPVDDVTALATAIENALGPTPDRRLLVERAREFSIEAAARQYVALIDALG